MPQISLRLMLSAVGCLLISALPVSAAEKHWSYQPVVRPPVPVTPGPAVPANPIDAFLLEKLRARGLGYAPAADRRTLLRRLSFDLTGLPPAWTEVESFNPGESPDAYDHAVERLLRSPHYGERMAQHWLDWVRYADTAGFHGDQPMNVWPYRDYVINAFNRNQPFDQFTIEQLAGDLLPAPATNQLVATAYNRLNRMTAENGANDAEYLAMYAADRVRTTASVWLGSTLACAQCHDHKHDPFSLREFYEFAAFFADIEEQGYYPDIAGWGPELKLPRPETVITRQKLEAQILLADAAVQQRSQSITADLAAMAARLQASLRAQKSFWQPLRPLKVETEGNLAATFRADDSVHLGQSQGFSEVYSVWLPRIRDDLRSLRLEILPVDGVLRWNAAENGRGFTLTEVELVQVRGEVERPVALATISATSGPAGSGSPHLAADGQPGTGWWIHPEANKAGRAARFTLQTPLSPEPDTRLLLRLRLKAGEKQQLLENFRLSFTTWDNAELSESGLPAELVSVLKKTPAEFSRSERQLVRLHLTRLDPELQRCRRDRLDLQAQLVALTETEPAVLITRARAPRPLRVLPRGNWLDESGPLVTPAVPSALGRLPAAVDQPTRLNLARWLVDRQQPLTARVLMNRLWKLHFGRGLVTTLDDFGRFGDTPSHPELLDWLAAEFMDSGWDWQRMVRLLVTSQAYQQQSLPPAAALVHDPENRLWSRQEVFRLDAELIRDNALAVSGLLVADIGGPSVRPYQPDGYYASLSFPVRTYVPSSGADQYRRGLYTHWQRTFLHPTLKVFDAPSREECVVARLPSDTPLQALALLNDPTFVEAARGLALRLLEEESAGDAPRLDRLFQLALQRLPLPAEQAHLLKLIEAERLTLHPAAQASFPFLHIGQLPLPPAVDHGEVMVWMQAARVLLNLHETIMRY